MKGEWVKVFVMFATMALSIRCTPSAKAATDVGLKIADDVCSELVSEPAPPDWVVVACQAEGVASGVIKVLLPRQQWVELHAKRIDAGPGK